MSKNIFSKFNKRKNKKSGHGQRYKKIFTTITLNSFLAFILVSFYFGFAFYRSYMINLDQKNIKDLEEYVNLIKKNKEDTSKNVSLAQKYQDRWYNASSRKKSQQNIDPNLINSLIEKLKVKYDIDQFEFNMSVPKKIDQLYSTSKSLNLFVSNCQLSFNSADDIRTIYLLKDLVRFLNGYVVINDFSIQKDKDYEFKDLLDISEGKSSGLLAISLTFDWYVIKDVQKGV